MNVIFNYFELVVFTLIGDYNSTQDLCDLQCYAFGDASMRINIRMTLLPNTIHNDKKTK